VWREKNAAARSKTMTDEHLAAMHRLLTEYHRKLAKKAVLDVVQKYHADLAQRLADEAAQIPRRTAMLERFYERERQKDVTWQKQRCALGRQVEENRLIGEVHWYAEPT
jgi:predicted RecB family nuclease